MSEDKKNFAAFESFLDEAVQAFESATPESKETFAAFESFLDESIAAMEGADNQEETQNCFAAFESFLDEAVQAFEPATPESKETFAAFESFLDESLTNTDALIDKAQESDTVADIDLTTAIESLLCPDCVAKLLSQVKTNIDDKCKTPEECDAMMEKVKQEAVKFNDCLGKMAEAAKGFKVGSITKEELANVVNPCLVELRQSCDVLKIGEGYVDKTQDVSDEDVANLRAFIIGTRDIIAQRKETLTTPASAPAQEVKEEDKKDAPNNEPDTSKANLADGDPNAPKEAKESEVDLSMIEVDEDAIEAAFESAVFDIALEGTNTDAINVVKEHRAELKKKVSAFKEAKKAKDYTEAAKCAKACAAQCKSTISVVNKLPNSVPSAILSGLAYTAAAALVGAVAGAAYGAVLGHTFGIGAKMGAVAGAKGGSTGAAIGAGSTILAASAYGKVLNKLKKGNFTSNDFNMLIACIKSDLSNAVIKWNNAASAMEKAAKAAPAKESATEENDALTADIESFLNDVSSMEIADEGSIMFILRQKFGFDAKETKAIIKEAKAKAKDKDFAGAIALYKKAKGMYEKALKKIESIPDKKVAAAARDSKDQYVADSVSKTAAINSFKAKIFKMENNIDKLEQARRATTKKATTAKESVNELNIFEELDINPALEGALDEVEDDEDDTLDDILKDALADITGNDHVKSDPSTLGSNGEFKNVAGKDGE